MKALKYNYKTNTLLYGNKTLYKDDKGIYTVGKYKLKDYIVEPSEVERINNFIEKL